jgi:hypothetical protein
MRATASAWPEAKVILNGQALQAHAVTGKQFWVARQTRVDSEATELRNEIARWRKVAREASDKLLAACPCSCAATDRPS